MNLDKALFRVFTFSFSNTFFDFWTKYTSEEQWRLVLSGEDPGLRRYRRVLGLLPASPRCSFCNAPFRGPGAALMHLVGRYPSRLNPRFCRICLETIPPGGAETELTMLFADVRGSTRLAEQMSASEFSRLINRFYLSATDVLTRTNALIERLIGDEVIGLYITGFAGPEHARVALQAAQELLRATGHGEPGGPWLPVGVGVHTGTAFVGKVGSEDVTDITVLGDAANLTARLASQAGPGEVLISDTTFTAAGGEPSGLEQRQLALKGRSEPVGVRVLRHR